MLEESSSTKPQMKHISYSRIEFFSNSIGQKRTKPNLFVKPLPSPKVKKIHHYWKKMEALMTRIDSQFKEIKGDMKEMRDGCNKCGGPHPSSNCDDKPMGGPKEEEANYASGGYRGNYYGRSSSNWRDRQSYHRDEN
ncbi:hypothetical protein Tco_0270794 [Tanacetum coccineum]